MMHHKVNTFLGEQIHYVDVTSLYPWVNKTALYPVGHPKILTNIDHTDISQYFGIAKVHVLLPSRVTSASRQVGFYPLSLVRGDPNGQTHG